MPKKKAPKLTPAQKATVLGDPMLAKKQKTAFLGEVCVRREIIACATAEGSKILKIGPDFCISDALHEEVERLLYAAVAELVFAIRNSESDEPEDACINLNQVLENVNTVMDKLTKL